MPLNTFTLGLNIGDLPEFCGPDNLSDAIISIRKSSLERHGGDTKWLSPISDEGMRRLIKLAYYTSCAMEEGRFPRFRLIITDHFENSIWFAAGFKTPINDLESLRRLAPAVSETDSALLITEYNDALQCTGSVIMNDMGFGTQIGRPGIIGVGKSPSLTVRVDGPGHIRATETGFTLVLNRGRIWQVVDCLLVQQVKNFWDCLAIQMADSTASIHGEESRKYFGGPHTLAMLIHKAWSRVLATTIDKQHGGAFVILPKEGKPEDFNIHCKYPAQMPFGNDILQFWQSCISHTSAKDDREREMATNSWKWRRSAVFDKAEILAGLSSVDGCVVLDQNLHVRGFGGEIRVDDEIVKCAQRSLKNLKTGELTPENELNQMGTRHRSAYRLAKVHPGIIVFVISQDGDLRIFCSNESNVFGFDRLHAWVHRYESE